MNIRTLLKTLLNHSTEIVVAIFILGAVLGIVKLAAQRIEEQFYNEVFYVYACPQNTNSSKCYKVKADFVPAKWTNQGNDFEQEWFETIYFGNGGYITFSACDLKDKTYTCYPEKESNGVWKLQIAEVIKVRK